MRFHMGMDDFEAHSRIIVSASSERFELFELVKDQFSADGHSNGKATDASKNCNVLNTNIVKDYMRRCALY